MRAAIAIVSCAILANACGRAAPDGGDAHGPSFAEVARLDERRAPSARLAAALKIWDEIDGAVSDVRTALPKDAPLPLADAPEGLARALAELIAAHEAGERLPLDDCFGKILSLSDLGHVAIISAPPGDARQLEAAAWLGMRIRDDRPSLIGAAVGMSVTHDAIRALDARGLPVGEATRATLPPDDLVARTFAREALCSARMMDRSLAKTAGEDALARGLIEGERAGLVALQESTLAAIVAAPTTAEALAAIAKASDQASASSSELVRVMFGGLGYADIEASRAAIASLLGAPAAAVPLPSPTAREVPRTGSDALGEELGALALVPDPRGVRLMNLVPEHPWYAWGARHGDLLQKVDDGVVTSPGDARTRLDALPVGAHRLVLARGDRQIVLPFTVIDPDAPFVIARSRVVDAGMLRRELEASGLTLVYDADRLGYAVSGLRPESLAASLGLRDGDRLLAIGLRSASEAHGEGQSGHAFLVDGLEGQTIVATVRRGDEAVLRLRWSIE